MIGINSCGGCPGKKAITRAAGMIKRGADTIVMASCITRGVPIGFPCPHAKMIKEAIEKKLGSEIKIIDLPTKENYSLDIFLPGNYPILLPKKEEWIPSEIKVTLAIEGPGGMP